MKQIVIEEPGKVSVRENVVEPVAAEGQALLRVEYCGICGADLASYMGNQPFTTYPRVPGHEFSASIISISRLERNVRYFLGRPRNWTLT